MLQLMDSSQSFVMMRETKYEDCSTKTFWRGSVQHVYGEADTKDSNGRGLWEEIAAWLPDSEAQGREKPILAVGRFLPSSLLVINHFFKIHSLYKCSICKILSLNYLPLDATWFFMFFIVSLKINNRIYCQKYFTPQPPPFAWRLEVAASGGKYLTCINSHEV